MYHSAYARLSVRVWRCSCSLMLVGPSRRLHGLSYHHSSCEKNCKNADIVRNNIQKDYNYAQKAMLKIIPMKMMKVMITVHHGQSSSSGGGRRLPLKEPV